MGKREGKDREKRSWVSFKIKVKTKMLSNLTKILRLKNCIYPEYRRSKCKFAHYRRRASLKMTINCHFLTALPFNF